MISNLEGKAKARKASRISPLDQALGVTVGMGRCQRIKMKLLVTVHVEVHIVTTLQDEVHTTSGSKNEREKTKSIDVR
jgi:hypothetical protein